MKRLFFKICSQWPSVTAFLFLGLFCLAYVAAADTLTVTIAGSGAGTVNSVPAGIACPTTCSASFSNLSGITLTATPDWKSLDGVFSAGCSGTGSCFFNISGDTGVTATFNPNYQATVLGHSVVEYATLTNAYANTSADGFFAAHEYTFMENLILDRDVSVTFYGGMGDLYLMNSGFTTLQGALEVRQGAIVVDALIIL